MGVAEISMGEFDIELETDEIAAFVWLEAVGVSGRFSDNGFMLTEKKPNLYFYSWEPTVTADQLKNALSVTSLMDIY